MRISKTLYLLLELGLLCQTMISFIFRTSFSNQMVFFFSQGGRAWRTNLGIIFLLSMRELREPPNSNKGKSQKEFEIPNENNQFLK